MYVYLAGKIFLWVLNEKIRRLYYIKCMLCGVFSRGFKWHVGHRSKITMPPKPTFYFIIWDTVFFKIVLFSNDLFYVNYLLYFPLKERLNFILMHKLYWFYLSLYLPYLINIVSIWIYFVLKTFLCFVFIKVLKQP